MKTIILLTAYFAVFTQAKPLFGHDDQDEINAEHQHNVDQLRANGINLPPKQADEVKAVIERNIEKVKNGGVRALINRDDEHELKKLSVFESAKSLVAGGDQAAVDAVFDKAVERLSELGINPSEDVIQEIRQFYNKNPQAFFSPESQAEVEQLLNKIGVGQ